MNYATSQQSDHTLRLTFLGVIAFGLVLSLAWVAFESDAYFSLIFTGCLTAASAICVLQISRFGMPSWRAGIPIYYVLMLFVVPLLQQMVGFADFLTMSSAPKAWMVCTAGLVAFQFGTIIGDWRSRDARIDRTITGYESKWPLAKLDTLVGASLCAAIGVVATIWSVNYGYYGLQIVEDDRRTTVAGLASSLTVFLDVAILIAWCRVAKKTDQVGLWFALACVTTFIGLYFGLYSNSKFALLKPLLYLVFAFFTIRRSLSIPFFLIAVLIYMFVIYPFITSFRYLYDYGNMSGQEVFANSLFHLTSLDWLYTSSRIQVSPNDSEAFGSFGRGLFIIFSRIIDSIDHGTPAMGQTFLSALYFLVPRAIWPSKPDEAVGNFIGQYIGVLQSDDVITNVSPTQMGEFYLNFGLVGVFVGMAIWGVVSRWVDSRLTSDRRSWLAIFFFFLVLLQESTLGQGILSFVKATLPYLAVAALISFACDLMQRRSSHVSAEPSGG